ncbi:phage DNA encapsidation protein, partial [Herbiconiux daphne]
MKYYNTNAIDKKNAVYNVIFGERSNGKTYALLLKGLKEFIKTGKQIGYVRRWKEDITGRRAASLFNGINENKEVEKLTKGEYTGVHYFAGRWYLCTYDENGKAVYSDTNILAYSFALSSGEHDKSTSYPNIGIIIFDEFLTNRLYLNDEFVLFMNCVSTIVRKREDVKIYMLGNTVNKFCPYFNEMGLVHVPKMKQGTIDVYSYGESKLTVAIE